LIFLYFGQGIWLNLVRLAEPSLLPIIVYNTKQMCTRRQSKRETENKTSNRSSTKLADCWELIENITEAKASNVTKDEIKFTMEEGEEAKEEEGMTMLDSFITEATLQENLRKIG
jgi:hypothetical protein